MAKAGGGVGRKINALNKCKLQTTTVSLLRSFSFKTSKTS